MLRINKTLELIPEEKRGKSELQPISSLLLAPTKDLRDVASAYADDLPRTIRVLMKTVGAWHRDGRLESYLMFEPGYIGDLIDLGYSDTFVLKKEISAFFDHD